jgi:hypothetical protein
MTDNLELGQVFTRELSGQVVTVVAIYIGDDHARFAIASDQEGQITLKRAFLSRWEYVPPNESDWYMEAVTPHGHLFWSLFIPGFYAARAFYRAQLPEIIQAGGYLRMDWAANATDDQRMAFADLGGAASKPFIGLDAARARLR